MIRFLNITEEEFLQSKLLYKHMPLENALRTLKDKYLWFASPREWKDPFERRFLDAKYTRKGNEVKFNWRNKVYCSCFTQTQSSEAFWNAYSGNSIGIEFRVYREALLEELKRYSKKYDIYIGKAEYHSTEEIIRTDLKSIKFKDPIPKDMGVNSKEYAARLFLLKRLSFSYENEIRIILIKDNEDASGIALNYNCDNNNLIQSIVLDPTLGDYTIDMLTDLFVKTYGFTPFVNKGKVEKRVLRSVLYKSQEPAVLKLD